MTLSMYQVSIPPFTKGLRILSQLLRKGQEHAAKGSVTEATLAESRLIEDMKPLTYQIQRVSDTAKGVAVRLGGVAPVPMADTETTFAEMEARIQATLKVLQSVGEHDMDAKEELEISLPGGRKFKSQEYLLEFAIPNFYFHLVTAYSLLRQEGVPIGKMDYMSLESK